MTENLYRVWAEERDDELMTSAEAWLKKVQRLVGFGLDGDEARDGYSLDGALAMFERGMSVRDAAASIAARALGGESR